jgi:gliding motility-associated-like protein
MLKKLLVAISVCCSVASFAQQQNVQGKAGWVVKDPFRRDVFIINNGQFSSYEKETVGDRILYYTEKDRFHFYFTPSSFSIRMDSLYVSKDKDADRDKGEKDDLKSVKTKPYFLKMEWVGSNPDVRIEAQGLQSDFFSYPNPNDKTGHSGITASAYKKLIYRNLYTGIDVELFYPEKGGIEYNIIVHPGADPSVVKMHYTGDLSVAQMANDVKIKWVSAITDHAPTAKDENGKDVGVSFNVHNNAVSFTVGSYDKSKTLTIDPWITATTLGGTNQAYDIGYDYAGNVYVYGGGANVSYKLQKYNSAGLLQWTYTATYTYLYSGSYFYGDLVVDHRDGTSYLTEGFDPSPDCSVIKVSTGGIQQAKGPGTVADEEWRIGLDYCNNQLCLALGGESGISAGHMDTNCTTMTGVNMLGGANVWDQSLLNFDNVGNVFIGTGNMYGNVGSPYGNMLCKMPLPTMSPTTYKVFDHHDFIEIQNIVYYPVISPYVAGNGFNGLVATPTRVYTYDGGKLRCWKSSNGTILDSATVSGTSYQWGGIDVDCLGNVYCGNNKTVSIYDSNCNSLSTMSLSNTVYDVAVAPQGFVYACGNGFVQSIPNPGHKMANLTIVQPGCSCNGSLTVNACGQGPFTYNWSNGATTSAISSLCSGSYTVTVKSGGCLSLTDTAMATLSPGSGSLTTSTAITSPACSGGNNGTASATASGGTSPYTYLWLPGGQTTTAVTGLSAGTYTCAITDKTGCTDSLKIVVTQPAALTASFSSIKNISCNGGTDGSLGTSPTGGTTPYSYSWSNGATGSSNTGLTVGSYTLTVTDSNGCTATASANISQPAVLSATINPINVSCNGSSTGSATANPTGGTPKYTYSWTNGATSNTATGLSAGNYTVTVTDTNGCSTTAAITITQPPPMGTVMGPNTNVKCHGGNTGSTEVTVSGGSPNYTYSWTGGSTNSSASGLSAGTYTVTVTDATGCSVTASTTITQPKQLKDSLVSTTQVACSGGKTGAISVGSIGGTPTYTYSWSPGGAGTSSTALSAGVYTITVTDSNGCTAMVTDTLKQPPTPKPSITGNDSVCPGGAVTLNATGGGTYSWSTGSTTSSILVTPTSNQTYTVTVTLGPCSADTTFKVSMYPVPNPTITGINAICNGSSTVLTGHGGGTYSWSNGMTTSSITVTPGSNTSYTLTVSNGRCSKDTVVNVTVNNPPPVSVTVSPNPACEGTPVTFTATGAPSYLWSNGATTSSITVSPDSSTSYTVIGSNGCADTVKTPVTILVPSLTACCDTTIISGDTVTINAYGDISYVWSPSTSLSCSTCPNPVASPTVTTTYTVVSTDGNGCHTSREVTIYVECIDFTVPNIFTPNNDGRNDDFVPFYTVGGITHNGVGNVSSYTINIYDRWGKQVYNSNDPTKYWNGTLNNTNYLVPDGVYYYIIKATCGSNNFDHHGFVQVLGGGAK